jgi:hypothetical protein
MPKPVTRIHAVEAFITACVLAGCAGLGLSSQAFAQAEIRSQSRVVPAGEARQLAFFTSLNPDCSADGNLTVRIAKQASHGNVAVDRGLGYTAYGRGDQRYVCNLTPEEGYRISYLSNDGYVGDDLFEIEVFSPAGHFTLWKYAVTVK